jgi:hypothetical protein
MNNGSSLLRSGFAKSSFLVSVALIIILTSSTVVVGNNPNNTVNVNARIQAARMVTIGENSPNQSGQEAFTAIDLSEHERSGAGVIKVRESIYLKVGSNVSWKLNARVENFEESREIIRKSGWRLERFRISWSSGKLKLGDSTRTMLSGEKGMHGFEVSYEVEIRKYEAEASPPSFEELKNVLVFTFE